MVVVVVAVAAALAAVVFACLVCPEMGHFAVQASGTHVA